MLEFEITGPVGGKSAAEMAFNLANGFFEAAIRCAESIENPSLPGTYLSPTTPCITNVALTIELYLKSILIFRERNFEKTHRFDRLFNLLDKDCQKDLRKRYAKKASVGSLDLKNHLSAYSNAFVEWRYAFEENVEVRLDRLFYFADALYHYIRDNIKNWQVNDFLDSRIRKGPDQKILFVKTLGGGNVARLVEI